MNLMLSDYFRLHNQQLAALRLGGRPRSVTLCMGPRARSPAGGICRRVFLCRKGAASCLETVGFLRKPRRRTKTSRALFPDGDMGPSFRPERERLLDRTAASRDRRRRAPGKQGCGRAAGGVGREPRRAGEGGEPRP